MSSLEGGIEDLKSTIVFIFLPTQIFCISKIIIIIKIKFAICQSVIYIIVKLQKWHSVT